MDNDRWRNVSIVLGLTCVVLIIAAGLLIFSGKGGPASTPTSLPSVTSGSSLESPTAGLSSSPSGPIASATQAATPTPVPTSSAPTATITFNDMMLDASGSSGATARTFTFTSDGYGPVGIQVTRSSPAGKTIKICAKVDGSALSCKTGLNPGFPKASADTPHSVWTVTLIGNGADTPTVDMRLSWPTATPKIQFSHGRLQGSKTPGVPDALNGFSATFQARAGGGLTIQAAWTEVTPDISVTLADVTAPTVINADEQSYSGVGFLAPAYTHNLEAGRTYKFMLRDTSTDAQRPDLTAQIEFP